MKRVSTLLALGAALLLAGVAAAGNDPTTEWATLAHGVRFDRVSPTPPPNCTSAPGRICLIAVSPAPSPALALTLSGSGGTWSTFSVGNGGGGGGGGSGTVTSVGSGTGLTGGPILTSGTISLADTAVAAGSYGDATHAGVFTVDQQGRLTSASEVAISGLSESAVNNLVTDLAARALASTTISAGTGLAGGGSLASNRTISLADTAVTPGTYTAANITVDQQGRITAAASGSGGGGGTVTSVGTGTGLTGGPITTSGTVSLANTAVAAGSYGDATHAGAFTVDAQGRLTSASSVSITGLPESAIANLTADLAAKAADSLVVHLAGAETITGAKSFQSGDLQVFNSGNTQKTTLATSATAPRTWTFPDTTDTAVGQSRQIGTGSGLSGGGDLSADRTISIANTAVTAGSYGDATHVSAVTVNAQGQLTAAASTSISGLAESAITGLVSDLASKATDSLVVHLAGAETITGVKTFAAALRAERTTVADADKTTSATADMFVAYTSLTAARTVTATVGGSASAPLLLFVLDESGSASGTNTIILSPSSGHVDGLTSKVVVSTTRGGWFGYCDGTDWHTIGTWISGVPALAARAINAGTGLAGGGDLTADRTISLANTAVTAGSYGDATHVPGYTVDAQGRLTAASSTAIAGLPESAVTNLTSDLAAKVPLAGGTMTGALLFSADNTIDIGASGATRPRTLYAGTSVIVPTIGTDASNQHALPTGTTRLATLDDVDGLDIKPAVRALSSSNVSSLLGLLTIDGVVLVDGNRVLLTGQTTGSQNGIWVSHLTGWTRPVDYATGASVGGSFVFVEQGTIYGDTGWVCTNAAPNDVVDTNSLTFAQFSGAGTYTAGSGLTLTGSQFSIDTSVTMALATAQTVTAAKSFQSATLKIFSSGNTNATTIATNASSARTWTIPDATDTACGLGTAQTFTAAKTFANAGPAKINNSADTFATTLASAATAARTWTLPDVTDTAVGQSRNVSTGNGLSGGGNLSADRTLTIDTSITVDKTTAQTLSSKTLTAPVINGATSSSGNFDLSGSSGTTKTTTGVTTVSGVALLSAAQQWERTTVADADKTTSATADFVIAYTSLSAARTVTATTGGSSAAPLMLLVEDRSGSASGTNTLTLSPSSGTIDGASTKVIVSTARGAWLGYSDGTNWFTLGMWRGDGVSALATRAISTGTGLSGGGDLTADRTLSLANTAVTAGTYGDSSHVGQFTVDAQGRLTAASNVSVAGGGTVTSVGSGTGLTGGPITGSGTLSIDQSFAPTWTGAHVFDKDAVGTAQTAEVSVENLTAAAAGAQQFSPCVELIGQGWKTNSTAASQTVKWCVQVRPVQGAANPTSEYVYWKSVNGGAYSEVYRVTDAGVNTATASTSGLDYSAGSGIFSTSTGAVTLGGNVTVSSGKTLSADGIGSNSSNQHTFPTGTDALCSVGATQTLTAKTLTTPVINGATSASGDFDLSGSSGLTKTTTGVTTVGGVALLSAAQRWERTTVADAAKTTSATADFVIAYTSLSAARTITATTGGNSAGPLMLAVIDESGSASATNTLTISPSSGTIDGASTKVVVNTARGAWLGYCDGTNWHTIGTWIAGVPAIASRNISTGTGLSGGGDLTADRTLSLANTAVTAGTYNFSTITVDAQGRLTAASAGTTCKTLRPETAEMLSSTFPQFDKALGTNFPIGKLRYDDTATESAYWTLRADDYGSGNFTAKINWYSETSQTTGAVVWGVSIAAIADGAAQSVETKAFDTEDTVTTTVNGTAKGLTASSLSVSHTNSAATGNTVFVKLRRVGSSGSDTMTGDADLITLQLCWSTS